jgi:hypothetical protein
VGKKNLLIGAFVAILVFFLANVLGENFWFEANQLVLNLESKISFNKKFSNENSIVLEFTKEEKEELLKNKTTAERKALFFNIVDKLDLAHPLSINIVLSKENKLGIFQNDIDSLKNKINSPVQAIQNKDIELEWINENNKKVLLDHSNNPIKIDSLNDFDLGLMDEEKLRSKNVFILSPNLNLNTKELSRLLNYFEGRSVRFLGFPKVLLFLCIISFSMIATLLIYPSRIALFGLITAVAFIGSQISYSFFNHYIEISELIACLLITLLIVSIFDLDFQAVSNFDFFKQELAEEFKNFKIKDYRKKDSNQNSNNQTTIVVEQNLIEEMHIDLKNKYYTELETKLEEHAIDLEERCFDNINTIQEKLFDLLSESEMSQRDNMRLGVIKHNFDQLLNEIEKSLFNMVPFRFEEDQGFINVLEQYSTKIYQQSKNKILIQIESDVAKLVLNFQDKVHIFRIIESFIGSIIELNWSENDNFKIALQIKQEVDNLTFKIAYQGKNIGNYKSNIKIQDCFKRLSLLVKATVDFEDKVNFKLIKLSINQNSSRVKAS